MNGDLLLFNGGVLTMDQAKPEATAIAIRGGKIAAVGTDAEAREAAGAKAEAIDLKGRTATPGLNDAHAHPMSTGFALADLNLASPPNRSISDLVALVAAETKRKPPGTWIVGRGYDQARLDEQRHPTRQDIDAIAPDHPVLLMRACHHIAVANSQALALANISVSTSDPDGGTIDRDEHGEPTGVVRETAMEAVRVKIGQPTVEEMTKALMLGGNAFLASGVSSTVEAGIHRPEEMHAYQRLRQQRKLPVRTYLMMIIDKMLEPLIESGIHTGFGDEWLRIGPAKLFSDGSIGGRTARMRRPYEGQAENVGLWMLPPEELKKKVRRAHSAGFQVGIHAIGDAAIELVLDAYEEAMTADPRPDPRHRIEHCSIVDEGLLARIAKLGVIPIPGTSFLHAFRDAYVQNLGMDRLRYTYGMSSYLRHGIIAAASTDSPVVPTSATIGLQTMMTRLDSNGNAVWPEEAISLDDALRAYTVNGAYASFQEKAKGTLKPGLLGDVTVFETDLRSVPATEIGQVAADLTIIEGNVAYQRPGM
ncbi:MAG: amidohydrolase [Thermomicrobiales bacterium]